MKFVKVIYPDTLKKKYNGKTWSSVRKLANELQVGEECTIEVRVELEKYPPNHFMHSMCLGFKEVSKITEDNYTESIMLREF